LPTGLLQAVDVLVWKPAKAEPAVCAPESAATEPATVGVCAVPEIVTPSNPQAAITTLAADALRRFGASVNAATRAQDISTVMNRGKRVRAGDRRALDIESPFEISKSKNFRTFEYGDYQKTSLRNLVKSLPAFF